MNLSKSSIIKIIQLVIIISFILVFFYAVYKFFYITEDVNKNFYLYFILGSLLCSVSVIYSFKLSQNFQLNLSLVFISIFITLFSIESFYQIKIILTQDNSNKIGVINNYLEKNILAYPTHGPSSWRNHRFFIDEKLLSTWRNIKFIAYRL